MGGITFRTRSGRAGTPVSWDSRTVAHRTCILHKPGRTRTWPEVRGLLGLPTLVHCRLGNLASAATLWYTIFLKLQLKLRDARPGRLEKRYAAGPRCFRASSKGTRQSTPGMGVGWTALSRPRRPAAEIWPLQDGVAVACLSVEGVHRLGHGPRHAGCVVRGWRVLLAGGSGGGCT